MFDFQKYVSKKPVDMTIKVETDLSVIQKTKAMTKLELELKKKENARLEKGISYVDSLARMSSTGNERKENRKMELRIAISKKRVVTLKDAMSFTGLAENTVRKYLREMDYKLVGGMIE